MRSSVMEFRMRLSCFEVTNKYITRVIIEWSPVNV